MHVTNLNIDMKSACSYFIVYLKKCSNFQDEDTRNYIKVSKKPDN